MIENSYSKELRGSVFQLACLAFDEDIPREDVTAKALELHKHTATAKIICRETICMSGEAWYQEILKAYFQKYPDSKLQVECHAEDGDILKPQSTLFSFEGRVSDIVALERTFLNFIGRSIGIASLTANYMNLVREQNNRTRVLDTRKTLPGFRFIDKYAVLCGGGKNHRMGLSDMVLIKENHIARLNGVKEALTYVKSNLNEDIPVQVEVETMEQLKEALDSNCPFILLDNFTPKMVKEACEMDLGESQLEVSGGVSMENIVSYCHPKLDRISIGGLTHSVKAPDLSLLIDEGK